MIRNLRRQRSAVSPGVACTVLLLLNLLILPGHGHGFEVFRHANMAGDVLATQGVGPASLALIEQGCRLPDIDGCLGHCYCPSWLQWLANCEPDSAVIVNLLSADHFDNNRLDESILSVNARVAFARQILIGLATAETLPAGWQRDYELAMIVFGKALHTVQDFYAHSNWVECQRDLVRIGGHISDLPLWNGEQWGCSTDIGGVTIGGLQTGYVDIATPAGSVTHGMLNKDSPSSAQGAIEIRRIYPPGVVATYYETVSGQLGGTFNTYTNAGAAPRHTIRAWEAVLYGTAVYNNGPVLGALEPATSPSQVQALAISLQQLMAAAEADSGVLATGQRIADLLADWDTADPSSYPAAAFDEDGLPVPVVSATPPPPAGVRLDQNFPNPFNPVTTIRFRLPRAERVSLVVYDLKGRHVRELLAGELAGGDHEAVWDGRDDAGAAVASGSYVSVLRAGDWHRSRRMMMVK